MAIRLGVDFGTTNTVVAVWDPIRCEGVPLHVPEYGRAVWVGDDALPLIPSVVHVAQARRRWIGGQVLDRNLLDSPRTFRWMKRFISARSDSRIKVDGREVTQVEAGREFLSAVLRAAAEEAGLEDEEVVLTVPVESFEHYDDWLTGVAEAAGMGRFRVLDEPSAAALGHGARVEPGHAYLVFDFGGGTLDIAVVRVEEAAAAAAATGRRCRVLGKAGCELGGLTIDQWLFEDVLQRSGRSSSDEDVRMMSRALLLECERAKERLSTVERADVSIMNPETGATLVAELTRRDFEHILEGRGALASIDATVREALDAAAQQGCAERDIREVFMVGGSSQIPAVRATVGRILGHERLRYDRALDAVARGAAAFAAGVDFHDHIQHDYAIRWANPRTLGYEHRIIIPRGTSYPTTTPVGRLLIKATYDGQTQLGIAIVEMGRTVAGLPGQQRELVFDPSGAARLVQPGPDEDRRRAHFWINEQSPTFLAADPPGVEGEPRFEVEFGVDRNKRLLITARDLRTGRLTHRDFPVVKLT